MDGRSVVIRPETSADVRAITRVNDAAFGRDVEGELVARLREGDALTISLVAVMDDAVIGHIAFSPMTFQPPVEDAKATALAPVAVLPDFQNRGIGGDLVRAGLDACRAMGFGAVFLVGHADYYPRFGFVKAIDYGIAWEFEAPDDAWMVIELRPGTLDGLRGATALFHPVFRDLV